MESKNNVNNIIQFLGLILMLVVFPAGSWFYLQSGLDYQRGARAELRDYGQLKDFQFTNQKGKTFNADELKGKISVVALVPETEPEQFNIINNVNKLNLQFQKRKEIQFLLHLFSKEKLDPIALKSFAEKHDITDDFHCKILNGAPEEIQTIFRTYYKWPTKSNVEDLAETWQVDGSFPIEKTNEYPYFVLLDTLGTIRNYYDARNGTAIKRLVEHLAIIMPKEKEEKAYLKRETEK